MRIVVAPQEYKGTLTAREAAEAIAEGVQRALPDAEIHLAPTSDGGPGFVDAFLASVPASSVRSSVQDPLGRKVQARWALLEDRTAVIEAAAAAGLVLLREHERDPRVTSTYGVGRLIQAAMDSGANRIIVGLGGSATNDGGAGMVGALGVRFLDSQKRALARGGAALARLSHIDVIELDPRVEEVKFIAATDVTNALCGPYGASRLFGAQKGATPAMAMALDGALQRYAKLIERDLGVRVLDVPGSGAAGGLAAGMIAFLAAEVRPGFDIVTEVTRLQDWVSGADLVITGEGRLDAQTPYGKTVARVARLARDCGIPVIAVPGSLGEGWQAMRDALDLIQPVGGDGHDARQRLTAAVESAVGDWSDEAKNRR